MNILVLYAEDYPWDVRVEKISRGLMADGHEVAVLARNLERRSRAEAVDGVDCIRVTDPALPRLINGPVSLPAFFNPVWRRALRRVIVERNIDLVLVRDLPLAPLAIQEARRHGIPAVVDMAENHPAMWRDVADDARFPLLSLLLKNPQVAERMERWVARNADAICVVVEEMKEHLVAIGCEPDRISIVSNTPELEKFAGGADDDRNAEHFGANTVDLVYVGFINEFRGLQHVIRAMGLLVDKMPNLRLVVAGDGDNLRELHELAVEQGVAARVKFLGWVAHEMVPGLIHRADIGVIPHRRTGHTDTTIPNKIFDYMACAKPAVVSDALPLKRLVAETRCGVSFVSGDPGSCAERLLALADPQLRGVMGRNGLVAVRNRFNWQQDLATMRGVVRERGHR